jgi:Flp pilus assembly protein protease CpaA
MGDVFLTFLLSALGLLLVSAGIEDARSRNIANWKNAAIALLAPLWWWANGLALWPDVAVQLGLAALVFSLFVGAFAIGQMGGGDVKLLGALALWLPVQPLVGMLVLMSLIGGALTIVMVAERWTQLRGGLRALPWRTIGPFILGVLARLRGPQRDRRDLRRATDSRRSRGDDARCRDRRAAAGGRACGAQTRHRSRDAVRRRDCDFDTARSSRTDS